MLPEGVAVGSAVSTLDHGNDARVRASPALNAHAVTANRIYGVPSSFYILCTLDVCTRYQYSYLVLVERLHFVTQGVVYQGMIQQNYKPEAASRHSALQNLFLTERPLFQPSTN